MLCRFMDIFPSFRIVIYLHVSSIVYFRFWEADYIPVSWKYWHAHEMMYVQFKNCKSDKASFIPEVSSKGWCQKNKASYLILSISCNAAVFTSIHFYSKFTGWSLSLLLAHENIVYIHLWLISIVFSLTFFNVQS